MRGMGFKLPPLVERLRDSLPADLPIALAGGAVRDLLLGREPHDYDFILPDGAMKTARRLGDRLGAAYFPLDEERDYGRLVWQGEKRILLDFSAYRGHSMEADLTGRDFTFNAIAVDLHHPDQLIDPCGGVNDLLNRQVRPCSTSSFLNDEVRVIRAARFAIKLDAKLPSETLRLMREAVPGLVNISTERLRDELFKILEQRKVVTGIRILETVGALPYVLPELVALKGLQQSPPHVHEAWEHTIDVVNRLQAILGVLSPAYDEEEANSLMLGMLVLRLGRYRQQLAEHFAEQLNPDRSLHALLNLAALYHDVGKPLTLTEEADGRKRFFEHQSVGAKLMEERGLGLRLGNTEIQRLTKIVDNHMRPVWLANEAQLPSRRTVYKFFKETGPAGVDVCLLALADMQGAYGATLPQERWARILDVVRVLLEGLWEHPEQSVKPPQLINGYDVMQILGLPSGPPVGEILEAVREAQAAGEINTREEALAFVREYMNRLPKS